MVRPRPVVTAAVALAVALTAAAPEAPAPPPAPLDRLPYRIRVLLDVDPGARMDAERRGVLVADWLTLVRRFVGAPWVVEVAGDPGTAAADPGSLRPEDLGVAARGVEKVWVIRVVAEGSGLAFLGRELDVTTGRLGPLQRRPAPVVRDAPRVLFQFALDLFSPYAVLGERSGKEVALTVRGASVGAASPVGRVVTEGAIFQPLRIVPRKDGPALVREIPYTFLRVDAPRGAGARCSVVSVYSDPFTRRVVQKTALAAVGIKPGHVPTRLRFQTLPDKAPAAGFVLTVRNYPDGVPREAGTTDREGRITLNPGASEGLLVLRLLAGGSEPMIEFPLMPGDSDQERTVPPFDPKPLTVALEARLDALRDEVIDLVAVRARLEARLKARFEGEDWPGAEGVLKEFRALPPRETFAEALTRLRDDAAARQAKTKSAVLTRTAQAQLADLQALIDRYLDDELVKGYADALEKIKAEPGPKDKAKAKGKPAAAAAAAPVPGAKTP